MRYPIIFVALCAVLLTGCGGKDRATLAQETVKNYWSDIGHGKIKDAYGLLSSGVRQQTTLAEYNQSFMALLTKTNGVAADVKKAEVHGDCAIVPVGLLSPKAPGEQFHVYQHLFWENGNWRITDPQGGVSQQHQHCPGS